MNKDKTKLFSEAPVAKAIMTLSLPVIAGMLVQVLYNLVDVFFIGRLYDANQIAAANLALPVFMIQMAFAGIAGTGAASFISRCLGKKDLEKANKTLSTGVLICIIFGVIFTVLGIFCTGAIVKVLGADADTEAFAAQYASILLFGSIIILPNFALGQLLRAEGAAVPAMIGMMIGTVGNIALDPLFIFTFKMGIGGAALATVIGNGMALLYYIICFARGKTLVKFKISSITLEGDIWKEIFSIGLPSTLSQVLMSAAIIVGNNLAVAYTNTFVAAFGTAMKILTIGTFVFMGFGAGCQPIIGYNYGAGNMERLKSVLRTGVVITVATGVALTAFYGIFASQMIAVLSPLEEVIDEGTRVMRIMMWATPILGPLMLMTTTVQAMGKAVPALILSIARQGLFYIPLMFLLNNLFGKTGLMWALPMTDVLTVIVATVMLTVIFRKESAVDRTTNLEAI